LQNHENGWDIWLIRSLKNGGQPPLRLLHAVNQIIADMISDRASPTSTQLPLPQVAALWIDKLLILDPVGASWDIIGVDHVARDAVRLLKDAGSRSGVAARLAGRQEGRAGKRTPLLADNMKPQVGEVARERE
jgi:hypothetical protein